MSTPRRMAKSKTISRRRRAQLGGRKRLWLLEFTTMTTHEAKIPYDAAALRELGRSPEEIEAHMRVLLAATLHNKGTLSLGKAAEMAGMPKVQFLFKLGELGFPAINLTGEEVDHELAIGR